MIHVRICIWVKVHCCINNSYNTVNILSEAAYIIRQFKCFLNSCGPQKKKTWWATFSLWALTLTRDLRHHTPPKLLQLISDSETNDVVSKHCTDNPTCWHTPSRNVRRSCGFFGRRSWAVASRRWLMPDSWWSMKEKPEKDIFSSKQRQCYNIYWLWLNKALSQQRR